MTLDVLTDFEVAARLCVTTAEVRRWAAAGEIPAARLPDGSYVFDPARVAGWLVTRSTGPAVGGPAILAAALHAGPPG